MLRKMLLLVFGAAWLIPTGFATPEGVFKDLYVVVLLVGVVSMVSFCWRADLAARGVVASLVICVLFSVLSRGFSNSTLLLIGDVSVGFVFTRFLRSALATTVSIQIVEIGGLAIDEITRQHPIVNYFPKTYFSYNLADADVLGFRAEGFIGQPVPAAMVCVGLGSAIFIMAKSHRRTWVFRLFGLSSAAVALFWTGTRAGLLVLIGAMAMTALIEAVRGKLAFKRAVTAGVTVGLVALALYSQVGSATQTNNRLFSFNDVAGTQSYVVRSSALSVYRSLPDQCSICLVVGHGQGGLQSSLSAAGGVDGLTTLDDQYLTTLWDFGLIGVAVLLCAAALAFRRLGDEVLARSAGAFGLLLSLLFGFFFEPLSLGVSTVAVGYFVGLSTLPLAIQSPRRIKTDSRSTVIAPGQREFLTQL